MWALDALHQPVEAMELYNKQTKVSTSTAPIAVTCLAFPDGETNEFYIGSEEGAVFQAFRHGRCVVATVSCPNLLLLRSANRQLSQAKLLYLHLSL